MGLCLKILLVLDLNQTKKASDLCLAGEGHCWPAPSPFSLAPALMCRVSHLDGSLLRPRLSARPRLPAASSTRAPRSEYKIHSGRGSRVFPPSSSPCTAISSLNLQTLLTDQGASKVISFIFANIHGFRPRRV